MSETSLDSVSNSPGSGAIITTTQPVRKNAGKLRLDLVPAEFDEWLAEVFAMGAEKYADNLWRDMRPVMDRATMEASMLRHLSAWRRGETNDAESGLHHLLHAAWNMLVQVYYEKKGLQNG